MRHVIGLSGGKDSTAMALWLVENEPRDYTFICTPTGDELPRDVRPLAEAVGIAGEAPLRWSIPGKAEQYASAEADEAMAGHTFRAPGRDTWPTALKDLRAEFEGGRIPKDRQQLPLLSKRPEMCRACSL